jgi:hypothetical protein
MIQPTSFFVMNAWRWACGLPEADPAQTMPPPEHMRETERSREFERLCQNRMIMGAFRYGALHAKDKHKYDRVASMRWRIDHYEQTGNLEDLCDISNIALCEFEEGEHPNRHFKSIDDGIHAQ